MRKLYLGDGDKQFKFADTTTEIQLSAFDDDSAAKLTENAKVRIKNDSGYLLGISASVANNYAIITSGQLAQLPAGSYLIELWDTVDGGTAIYPSDGFLALQINENVTSLSGGLVNSITVDDFIQQFSDLSQQLKQEVTDAVADKTVTPEKTTFIDNRLDFELELGTISNGVNGANSTRLRTKGMLKNPNGITLVRKNENLLYGVAKYVDGVWDGADSGWINANETYIEPGKDVRFNIRKADNSGFTSGEIENIHNDFEVRFSFRSADYYDLEDVKDNLLVNNNVTHEQFEYGGITGNLPAGTSSTRVRLKEFMQVNKNDKIMFNKDRTIFKYGISVSNLDGAWNGTDYGWMNDEEFIVPHDSIVKLIISYANNRNIIESDFNAVTDNAFTIVRTLKSRVESNTRQLAAKEEITEKKEAINSVFVEYGRLSGASYVFARIPKTTNTGKRLLPKLALTSSDGSLSGTKKPALRYAKDNDPIFTINAGLFNVSMVEPVGQLIIDGVSLINTPMTSDNGVPISPNECYPLAIDGNGDLTTYPRNADTADMIADGVKYAVTAWGKLVDNFEIATVDIENEIVHSGRYIRQSIGQYQNGDYCVCTVDMTRGSVTNEAGLYYEELAQIFVDKGVKFAYSLDGGGSAATVLGKRQLNPIYEGPEGRAVPTVITFKIDK